MELLATSFQQTAQGDLLSSVTFPVFSLLNIIFIFLTFTLDPLSSMLLFKLLVSFSGPLLNTNAKSSAKSSFSGDPDKIYLDSASITMTNNM